jgi:PAS domain-containing protein
MGASLAGAMVAPEYDDAPGSPAGIDMPQRPIELILQRQLASYLATPMFVVDTNGTLVYYNEAAEPLLGRRFEETSEMTRDDWLAAFAPHEVDGRPIARSDNPLLKALAERREQHRAMAIRGLDGAERLIETTCLPIVGQGGLVGAVAVFWAANR